MQIVLKCILVICVVDLTLIDFCMSNNVQALIRGKIASHILRFGAVVIALGCSLDVLAHTKMLAFIESPLKGSENTALICRCGGQIQAGNYPKSYTAFGKGHT